MRTDVFDVAHHQARTHLVVLRTDPGRGEHFSAAVHRTDRVLEQQRHTQLVKAVAHLLQRLLALAELLGILVQSLPHDKGHCGWILGGRGARLHTLASGAPGLGTNICVRVIAAPSTTSSLSADLHPAALRVPLRRHSHRMVNPLVNWGLSMSAAVGSAPASSSTSPAPSKASTCAMPGHCTAALALMTPTA